MPHKLFIAALLTSVLAACGQRGPLYLPQDVPADNNQTEQSQSDNTQQGETENEIFQTPIADKSQSLDTANQSVQPEE